MAKPIVIFLVLAASCVFAKGGKPKRERCSCKTFSLSQERKLREILQSEALNLQTGLQEMCGQQKPVRWMKVTPRSVCFGARGDQFGTVTMPSEGFVAAIKLLYTTGYLSCNTSSDVYKSKWGCGTSKPSRDQALLNTYITCDHDVVLFPADNIVKDLVAGWYKVPEADSSSLHLVLSRFASPVFVRQGQQLRLWYGEDLLNHGESNNSGTVCAHVFVWYN